MSEPNIGQFKEFFATAENADIGPTQREGTLSVPALNKELDRAFESTKLPPERSELIRSLLLLWHDHLDESHTISQSIETADGSFLHAMMHRREPDYWNAKYWWRRVGAHPAFPEIAKRVETLLPQNGAKVLAQKLVPNGKWDASAFVDACEAAATSKDAKQTELLRAIQRIEFEVLLERFVQG